MKLKMFENFKSSKSVAVYHGYKGDPNPLRIDYLKSLGYEDIYYPHIDYDREWKKDKCKSLFERELKMIKGKDLIIGFSLGGYFSFELAGHSSTDLVLINPALDRSKTKLDVTFFDISTKRNFSRIEAFLGSNDTLIDKNDTINYLENFECDITIIEGMEHRTYIEYFKEICNKSNLI